MHPFQRILLATEHTDFDVGAERIAFELARTCGLPLAGVIPLVSNPEYEATAPEQAKRAEQDAARKLAALRSEAHAGGVALDIRVRRGEEPYREIISEATARGSDLIVTRRRGRRGFLAHLLVGEMVGKVAALAPCSVLLVPRAARMWTQRILACVDPSPAAETVAATAARIARVCTLPLSIASAVSSNAADGRRVAVDDALARAAKAAAAEGITAETRALTGSARERLLELAMAIGADLIVVGRRGERGGAPPTSLGSTAHELIGHVACPVLVVRS